jgi:hypothetical protein
MVCGNTQIQLISRFQNTNSFPSFSADELEIIPRLDSHVFPLGWIADSALPLRRCPPVDLQ